jgi:type IV secretory pathway TrbF-like protein
LASQLQKLGREVVPVRVRIVLRIGYFDVSPFQHRRATNFEQHANENIQHKVFDSLRIGAKETGASHMWLFICTLSLVISVAACTVAVLMQSKESHTHPAV